MAKGGLEKIELNRAGVAELLKSPEMRGYCEDLANRAASGLGEGYEVTSYTGKTRANASIHAATSAARRDNMEHNSLLKAIGGLG